MLQGLALGGIPGAATGTMVKVDFSSSCTFISLMVLAETFLVQNNLTNGDGEFRSGSIIMVGVYLSRKIWMSLFFLKMNQRHSITHYKKVLEMLQFKICRLYLEQLWVKGLYGILDNSTP
jgi:hypothetical protein